MKRLCHRKHNLCLRMNYDELKSIFECTQWVIFLLDYEDKVSIFHKNRFSYLVNVEN